jgi:predicted small metal-binding protein
MLNNKKTQGFLANDSLEEIKKQIVDHAKENGLNMFYTTIVNDVKELLWDNSEGDWKQYLKLARDENIKTIIFYEFRFSKAFEDLFDRIKEYELMFTQENTNDLENMRIKRDKYIDCL